MSSRLWFRGVQGIAAAAVLVLTTGTLYWYLHRQAGPEFVLAKLSAAYTDQRTIELRIPGAKHADLVQRRGPADSMLRKPEDLLQAAVRIRSQFPKANRDAQWLHARGRLAILEWHPDEAIESLQVATDLGGSSVDTSIDLATAYYQKGTAEQSAADLNKALEILGPILDREPRNEAALFNRAVIERDLHLFQPAIADLEKLLAIAPKGPWRDEAQAILTALMRNHARIYSPLGPPETSGLDEVLLDSAMVAAANSGIPSLAALQRSLDRHGDRWISDLVKSQNALRSSSVVAALSGMSKARLTVDKSLYYQLRPAFESTRSESLPPALKAWRDYEDLYRVTHARASYPTPLTAGILDGLRSRNYKWLEIQFLRELGYLELQNGNTRPAEEYARQSVKLANDSVYPVSAVRSQALLAHCEIRYGRYRTAINLANRTIKDIVNRNLPVARIHEFLNVMLVCSETWQRWHAARAVAAALTTTAEVSGFRDLRFTNAMHWAELALRCGDRQEASRLLVSADHGNDGEATMTDRAWPAILSADATGDDRGLDEFASGLENATEAIIWVPYQRTRARIDYERGRIADASRRLDRIAGWLKKGDNANNRAVPRWPAEVAKATELALALTIDRSTPAESFQVLQYWRSAGGGMALIPADRRASSGLKPLVFALAEVGTRIAVWQNEAGSVSFRWADLPRADIQRSIRRHRRLLNSPDSPPDAVLQSGIELRNTLFGHWLQEVSGHPDIVIQAQGALANVAFGALPGAYQPLGFDHAIAVTPFALPEDVGELASDWQPGRMILIDGSHPGRAAAGDLHPLSGVEQEISEIERLVGTRAEVLSGAQANARAIAERSAGASLLHFAGHAVRTAAGTGLALPEGDTAFDPLSTRFRSPPLVVLSACSTGRRDVDDDEDAEGDSLAASFLLSGSREVIASLWDVDSQSAAGLMSAFYRELLSGREIGAALQSATRSLASVPKYSHPYYWASFTRFKRTY